MAKHFNVGDLVLVGYSHYGPGRVFWKGKCKFKGINRYGVKYPNGDVWWGYASNMGHAEPEKPVEAPKPPRVYGMSIDFSKSEVIESRMEAWSDFFRCEAPYEGVFNEEEAKELCYGKPDSSYGALRWSGGKNYSGHDPERKVVEYCYSVRLAD